MAITSWHTGPLLAFDTETSGPLPDTARIVTAYMALLFPGQETKQLEWLADPGVPIPEAATAVHGITTDHAREHGQPARQVIEDIAMRLQWAGESGVPIIGHNASYDCTVVDRECRRHGVELPDWDALLVIDTHVLDKHVWPYRPGSRRLVDVAAEYGVPIQGDAHTASADALAAARIGHRIATIGTTLTQDRDERHAEWKWGKPSQHFEDAVGTATELHERQRTWARDQARGLEKHFKKTNPNATVDGTWPIRQLPPNWNPTTTDPTTTDPIEVTA